MQEINNINNKDIILNSKQVAELLQVQPVFVINLAKELGGFRLTGKPKSRLRFYKSAVEKYIAQQKI